MKKLVLLFIGPIFLPFLFGSGQLPATAPTPTPYVEPFTREGSSPDFYAFGIYDAEPRPDIPTLQEIAGDATTDTEALGRIVDYYTANEARLSALWREDDPARLRGFFAMYVIHVSHPYGVNPRPWDSLVVYLGEPLSHCGPQSVFEGWIMGALGLEWRRVGMSSNLHGWTEARINGQWEIFDATSNTWINRSGFDLLDGGPRSYRRFYTPWTDEARPEFRQVLAGHEATPGPYQYTPGAMRSHMPGLGIYFIGAEYRRVTGVGLVVLGN